MINLEARGVVGNKFDKPFRRKKQWSIDWSDYTPITLEPKTEED